MFFRTSGIDEESWVHKRRLSLRSTGKNQALASILHHPSPTEWTTCAHMWCLSFLQKRVWIKTRCTRHIDQLFKAGFSSGLQVLTHTCDTFISSTWFGGWNGDTHFIIQVIVRLVRPLYYTRIEIHGGLGIPHFEKHPEGPLSTGRQLLRCGQLQSPQNMGGLWFMTGWWLSPTALPLWKIMDFVSWHSMTFHDIPIWMGTMGSMGSMKFGKCDNIQQRSLVGGAITILKNDGVPQWEGWKSHEMENKKCLKPPTRSLCHCVRENNGKHVALT